MTAREREIGVVMRLLLAVVGVAALAGGAVVGVRELRVAQRGGWPLAPALATAAFCLVVVAGGAALLRGAARGRIVVRR